MLLLKNKKGQGLIEYLVIMALMAVATMAIMRVLSQTVTVKFAQVTEALQGREAKSQLQTEQIQTTHVKKKDMSDFFHGAKSSGNKQDEN
jgi:pilus assembly protein Flp/PilA